MKIENEKIIQATEDELYSYWLSRGWDDVYSFPEYMQRMKNAGCEVIAEIPPTVFDRITASPEVLAPHFVYHVTSFLDGLDKPKKIWYSTLINNQYFNTELEAKRATVAKLNEVEK